MAVYRATGGDLHHVYGGPGQWPTEALDVSAAARLPAALAIEPEFTPLPPVPWCGTFDFTGNILPPGWTMTLIRAGAGLLNDRVEAHPVDGVVQLNAVGAASAGLSQLVVDYDGLNALSYWGMHRELMLRMSSGAAYSVTDMNAEYNFGANNLILRTARMLPAGSWTVLSDAIVPFAYGAYHYRIVIDNELVAWSVVRLADNKEIARVVHAAPGLFLNGIASVQWEVQTTDYLTWGDNLALQCGMN